MTAREWQEFLARHDLVWDRMPTAWPESAFAGNGAMGTMIYQHGERSVRFDVGHSLVRDHREIDDKLGILLCKPRLPIGYFSLDTVGTIKTGAMILDLWNAEARGEVVTDAGLVRWRALVPAEEMAILVEVIPDGGELNCAWKWHPLEATPPCARIYGKEELYTPNPPYEVTETDGGGICIQPLLVGGEAATAWRIRREANGRQLLSVTVAHSHPEPSARNEAAEAIKRLAAALLAELVEKHRAWWHAYYPASFVTIPDTRWEGFYWIQMYKLGSATRADGPIIDCTGPWLEPTAWPAIWWNMNAQLTYWPVYASNRLHLGESLCNALDRNMENLVNNVEEQFRHDSAGISRATAQDCVGKVNGEVHCLPWACHNYWLQYRYSMDDDMLRRRLYPLLRRSINYIIHHLEEGEPDSNGRRLLHLVPMLRGEQDFVRDNTAVLALLRSGCTNLIWSCRRLGIDDPLLPKWQDILERLAPYPADDKVGLLHHTRSLHPADYLLAVYPLHLLTPDGEQNDLLQRSLDFWYDTAKERYRNGWLFTHGAAMMTCSGRHDRAAELLNRALDRTFTRNTFYHEDRDMYPVIESPLAGAAAMHELLLQSWGGTIRVFPGIPRDWQNAAFCDLRAEGAFLVSAVRQNNVTRFVRIRSLAGEPCRVQPGLDGPPSVRADRKIEVKDFGNGTYGLDLRKGEEAILYAGDSVPDLTISPVPPQTDKLNYYGLNIRSDRALNDKSSVPK